MARVPDQAEDRKVAKVPDQAEEISARDPGAESGDLDRSKGSAVHPVRWEGLGAAESPARTRMR